MILEITEVLSKIGKAKDFLVEIDVNEITTASGTYPIIEKKPFEFHLVNEENRRLHITCSTVVQVAIPCDRCLEDVSITIPVEVDKYVPLKEGVITLDEEDKDEFAYVLDNHHMDSNVLIFDEILVNWPAKVLCKDDCKGLCPDCGQNLNIKDCGCDRFVPDPRMAGIQDIFKNFKEV